MFEFDKYELKGEVWKDIPGYEGIYQASSFGRIRTIDGKITHSIRHGVRKWKGRILKNKTKIPAKIGYMVTLWKNKKPKDFLVARLIGMTFLGLPKFDYKKQGGEDITINHLDGDRLNNNIDNLEWCTIAENIRHGFRTGLFKKNQKAIILQDDLGNECYFPSMSEASRWLGKKNGYVSNCLIKGSPAVDKYGQEWEVIFKEE